MIFCYSQNLQLESSPTFWRTSSQQDQHKPANPLPPPKQPCMNLVRKQPPLSPKKLKRLEYVRHRRPNSKVQNQSNSPKPSTLPIAQNPPFSRWASACVQPTMRIPEAIRPQTSQLTLRINCSVFRRWRRWCESRLPQSPEAGSRWWESDISYSPKPRVLRPAEAIMYGSCAGDLRFWNQAHDLTFC